MSAPDLTTYADGFGVLYADQLNTFCQTCDNLAQLADFIGVPGIQVFVRGTVDVGDGGQGVWFWNADGIGPTNNADIVVPTGASSGAWERLSYAPYLAMFLPKTSEVPARTVTGGTLYVDATGALQYLGPSTTTELAPP